MQQQVEQELIPTTVNLKKDITNQVTSLKLPEVTLEWELMVQQLQLVQELELSQVIMLVLEIINNNNTTMLLRVKEEECLELVMTFIRMKVDIRTQDIKCKELILNLVNTINTLLQVLMLQIKVLGIKLMIPLLELNSQLLVVQVLQL